jgi:adenine-specific DNA-methyltransferase
VARRQRSTGPTPVDAIKHGDKRVNIPTADDRTFVDDDLHAIRQVRYARDESLDPQLVWKGKYPSQDEIGTQEPDLVADAPPIYIQEKIDPRVLIENLRRTAERPEDEPELALFDSFDGLDELSAVEYYQHAANWSNRMILGDSLQVMSSLAEREQLRGKVQMIYVDPPYGIRFGSNWQPRVGSRDVKDGNLADAAREAEQIKAFRDTWELGIHSYLSYLRDRLLCARELLAETGSCFVQIGDENVHLVRNLMDEVFGSDNLITMIAMKKTSGATAEFLSPVTDYVVWYAKDRSVAKYRQLFETKGIGSFIPSAYGRAEDADGTRRSATPAEKRGDVSTGTRLYALGDMTSPRVREARTGYFPIEIDGKTFLPKAGEWKTNREGIERLRIARRIEATANRVGYVRFLDDFPAYPASNFWDDTVSSFMADKVYVVQTTTKVIQRCMLMATDPGDLVLDPTCGSGTTAFVAEQWGRRGSRSTPLE